MKVIVFGNNLKGDDGPADTSWYVVADSAISNSGKPFFIPDGEKVEAALGMAVRISRLGKSIAPRFARRYYHEIAPAVHFRLPEKMRGLRERMLPVSPAVSFDRSVMTDFYREVENPKDLNLSMRINGKEVLSLTTEDFSKPIEELIGEFSKTNTVKIGDVIVPCLTKGVEIAIGDYIELCVNGLPIFNVKIK